MMVWLVLGFGIQIVVIFSVLPIQCKVPIKPNELSVPVTFTVSEGNGPCKLKIREDLPKPNNPQPFYIIPNTNEIWNPNRFGYITIEEGSSIEIHCPNSFANLSMESDEKNIPKNVKTIIATCIGGRSFAWRSQKYEFRQFVCSKPTKYLVERLEERCAAANSAQLYRVGYNLTKNRFIESMQICYDELILRNHYTHYKLYPGSANFQLCVQRVSFIKAGFLGSHNIYSYYKPLHQVERALEIFNGNNAAVQKLFNGKNLFLARGHLAAKADFIYANQQHSTFTYLNVAPQWQSFNGGYWGALERAVREYVTKTNKEVDCYSGTWGTLHIKSSNNNRTIEKPFYLANDSNNNGILPVPKFFYRVIVDSKNPKRGIALLGVNNPHATMQDIDESYILCKNIAPEISWLQWISNADLKKGYIYACSVAELYRVIKILPSQLSNVNQILI